MIVSAPSSVVCARRERRRTARRGEVELDGQVVGRVIHYGLWAGARSSSPTSLPLSPKPQHPAAVVGFTLRAVAMAGAGLADIPLPRGPAALVSAVDLATVAILTEVKKPQALRATTLP
jgi:hypothetical protein